MPQSVQKKLERVRPPRVHVTYDVETGGAIEIKESNTRNPLFTFVFH